MIAALLLMAASVQTAWTQGFRVFQSDGTELQFSLKTDSIVFDNSLNGDEVFGPFTPVNLCIARTWYKSMSETVTFGADGTTDYIAGGTYEFMPYQGNVIIYNASGAPVNYFKVLKVTAENMVVSSPDGSNLSVWSSTQPAQLVTVINGHEYVEIGGLKWATMNVGATTVAGSYETCFGDYFAWGETEPRYALITRTSANEATFTWRDGYSRGYSSSNIPTYIGTWLDAAHDAATSKWGSSWRTPEHEEFMALAKACSGSDNWQAPVELKSTITVGGIYWLNSTQTIESAYTGVAGLLFVSKADISKRVFFPACGRADETNFYKGGTLGYYWSSSLYTSNSYNAYNLVFYSSNIDPSNYMCRYSGYTVRPVSD